MAASGEETRAKVCAESEASAALWREIDFALVDKARAALKKAVLGASAGPGRRFRLCFCHNDLLPANLMVREGPAGSGSGEGPAGSASGADVRIIDLEYGSVNYAAFDVANHLMEYAGGATPETEGRPEYDRLPDAAKKRMFVRAYLEALSAGADCEVETEDEFFEQIELFAAIDNVYWGLWGVNQARIEGCKEFPYLLYGRNRLARGLLDGGFAMP